MHPVESAFTTTTPVSEIAKDPRFKQIMDKYGLTAPDRAASTVKSALMRPEEKTPFQQAI